jgi:hypothetical protein
VKEGELNPVDEGGADSVNEEGELELVGEGKPVILEPESRGVVATSTVLEKRNVDPSNDTSVPKVVAASVGNTTRGRVRRVLSGCGWNDSLE